MDRYPHCQASTACIVNFMQIINQNTQKIHNHILKLLLIKIWRNTCTYSLYIFICFDKFPYVVEIRYMATCRVLNLIVSKFKVFTLVIWFDYFLYIPSTIAALKYTNFKYSLQQSWWKWSWRCRSYCTCWCSEGESEFENVEVSTYWTTAYK